MTLLGLVRPLGRSGRAARRVRVLTGAARAALAGTVPRGLLDRLKGRWLVFDHPMPRALVSRAWDLDAPDGRYRAFTREFSPYRESRRLDDREAFLLRTRLVHAFRRFPALDPELPDDLVRAPRHRAEAVALFHRLYNVLAPPAQRHFEEVTTPP